MSEGSGDSQKTKKPTPKRIKDARSEGQFVRSKDLQQITPILTVLIIGLILNKWLINVIGSGYLQIFQILTNQSNSFREFRLAIWLLICHQAEMVAIFVLGVAVVNVFVNIMQQGGITLAKQGIKFNFNNLNLANNFKQLFSGKNFLQFVCNVVKIIVLIYLSTCIVKAYLHDILLMSRYSFLMQIKLTLQLVVQLGLALICVCLVFAAIDYIINYRALMKRLMMSFQEVKNEHKETNGNPEIGNRRKELHRELTEDDSVFDSIQKSTMVLANPTHIAIVIWYSPQKYPLPIVMYKACGRQAQQIFTIAKRCNVPIIRDKWLARQLFQHCELGKYVQKRFLAMVAEVFNKNMHLMPKLMAEIISLRAKTNTANSGNLNV